MIDKTDHRTSYVSIKSIYKRMIPLLLSHHPMCSFFDEDTYEIIGRRICLGCSLSYPLTIIVVVSSIFLKPTQHLPELLFHQDILFLISVFLGSFQLLKYSGKIQGRGQRIIVKILLGLSLGGGIVWVFTLPVDPWIQILLFFFFFLVIQLIGLSRYTYLRRRCSKCIYHGDWDICYGFRHINKYNAFRNIRTGEGIKNLIFNIQLKSRENHIQPLDIDTGEPELYDRGKWVYHDDSYDIPFLPKTGLEVRSKTDIP